MIDKVGEIILKDKKILVQREKIIDVSVLFLVENEKKMKRILKL